MKGGGPQAGAADTMGNRPTHDCPQLAVLLDDEEAYNTAGEQCRACDQGGPKAAGQVDPAGDYDSASHNKDDLAERLGELIDYDGGGRVSARPVSRQKDPFATSPPKPAVGVR